MASSSSPALEQGKSIGDADEEICVNFHNHLEKPVKVVWVDFDGDEDPDPYAIIRPGGSGVITTFEDHLWRVYEEDNDTPVLVWAADDKCFDDVEVEIGDPPSKQAGVPSNDLLGACYNKFPEIKAISDLSEYGDPCEDVLLGLEPPARQRGGWVKLGYESKWMHSVVSQISDRCKEKGTQFVDLEFPPVASAVGTKHTRISADFVQWKRAADVSKSLKFSSTQLRSQDSDVEYTLRISYPHASGPSLALYWVNFEGLEERWATIHPGGSICQDTFISHPWVLRTIDLDDDGSDDNDEEEDNEEEDDKHENEDKDDEDDKKQDDDDAKDNEDEDDDDDEQKDEEKRTLWAVCNPAASDLFAGEFEFEIPAEPIDHTGDKKVAQAAADPVVFDGIDASDILQGYVGNCWLMQSLSSVAAMDCDAIQRAIYPAEYNPAGVYAVKLYHPPSKKWMCVLVDDYLPVNDNNSPCFARMPGCKELWVCLLEKAWAKINGSYGALDASHMRYQSDPALVIANFIGGTPKVFSWHPDNKSPLANKIRKKNKLNGDYVFNFMHKLQLRGAVMSLSSMPLATPKGRRGQSGAKELVSKKGMVDFHGYSVLQIVPKVDISGGNSVDLIHVRNTWGNTEWTGRWSDRSPLWDENPLVKSRLGLKVADDGEFWMDSSDFVKHFCIIWYAIPE